MFQKKVTIGADTVSINVSNDICEVGLSLKKDTPKLIATQYLYTKKLNVNFKVPTTKELENYWWPQLELILSEIINSIYSIGLENLDPEKNFADYELVKEDE